MATRVADHVEAFESADEDDDTRQAQANHRLRESLERFDGTEDLMCLTALLAVLFDAPFVVLVPQLERR